MGITRPTGEQLRFRSQFTGDHVLDTYLEASEKGGRAISDLLDDLFDSSGVFRAANFEFQFDPSVDKIQFRAGNFASPSAGWTDITTFFNITGTFNAATTYQNFDLATTSDKDVYIVHGLSSGTTFANEAAFIASSNTTRIVDVSEARDWAKKTDGIVDSTDYSSKAWAIGGTGVTNSATGGAAKEWAIKTSGTVDGTNYSAKYWATSTDVVTVSTNIADVTTVASDISNVNTVSTDISNVNTTASNIASVNTVAAEIGVGQDVTVVAANIANVGTAATNIANINTAAGSIANVNTVAGSITNVNTVSTNIANVNTVAPYVGAGNDITVVAAEITNNNLQTVAADIQAVIDVADDLNEATSEIDTVANSIANVDAVGTDIANVNTVAGSITNVNTAATNSANINTVAGISANVTTVAGISGNVTTVAGIASDVTTTAGISTDVTAVSTNNANVTTVASNISNVNAVGGITANVTTVAGIAADVTTAAGISSDITTVAGISADVTTAATNVTAFNNTYLGAQSSAPTQDPDGSALDLGDLYFDTTTSTMKVYSASGWINAGSSVNGTADRFTYTATAAQTTFTGNDDNTNSLAYDAGFLDVYMNGVKLVNGSDFTATNGTSIVLASGAAANDTIEIIAYGTFVLADHLTETQSDAKYVEVAGDTMTGSLAGLTSLGIGTASPAVKLDITPTGAGTFGEMLRVKGTNTGFGQTAAMRIIGGNSDSTGLFIEQKGSGNSSGSTASIYNELNSPLRFGTNNTYAGQFDASGNFLVGTTDASQAANTTGNGTVIGASGGLEVSRDSFSVAYFNKTTATDGNIIELRKQGGTIGTLGVESSVGLALKATASSGYISFLANNQTTGIFFDDVTTKRLAPYSSRDNEFDLGDSDRRWKDLYLSGSARLGMEAANPPAWVGSTSTVVADNLFGFQGASYSNACYNISVDNNYTYFLHNAYYGSGGWTQRLTGYNPTLLQSGTDGFFFNRAASTGSDTAISWTALAAFKADTAVFNEGGNDIDFRVESTTFSNMLFVDASNNNVNIKNAVSPDASNSMNIRGNIRLGADTATRGDTIRSAGGASAAYNGIVLMSNHINQSDQANTTLPSWLVDIGGSWADGTNFPPSTADGITIARRAAGGAKYSAAKYLGINSTATVINEDSNDHDFRVESDAQTHAFFVDASANHARFGPAPNYSGATASCGVLMEGIGGNGQTILTANSSNTNFNIAKISGYTNSNYLYFYVAGAAVGSISTTGTGVQYNTTSDRRLKDNIEPIADGTEKLMAMKPVTHTWKSDPEADAVHGFIAQEMIDVIPEAVSGDPDGEEMMSMDYGRITPVLVAALQDAHKKIEALEERLAELEAK